jgi:hypothetical protein
VEGEGGGKMKRDRDDIRPPRGLESKAAIPGTDQPLLEWRWLLLSVAILILAVVLRFPSLFEPRWYGDEGVFAAIAQSIRHGEVLYSQATDNKTPLVFFSYALVQVTLGSSVFALHLAASAVTLATLLASMMAARMLFGTTRSLVAGIVFALLMCTPVLEGNLALTETFMILPSALALLAFLLAERQEGRKRLIGFAVVGLLIGLAVNYKQVAVFDGAALALIVLLAVRRPVVPLAAMGAGFVLPQAFFMALFLQEHALSQYIYAVIGSLGAYSGQSIAESYLLRAVGYLPALFVATSLVKQRLSGDRVPLQKFPALWLSFAFAGAISGPFAFPHYLQQAAPAAALTVAGLNMPRPGLLVSAAAKSVAAVLIGLVVFSRFLPTFEARKQLHPVWYYKTFISHQWGSMDSDTYGEDFDGSVVTIDDIASDIKADGAGDTVYVWGDFPWLYVQGDFRNPTPYFTSFLPDILPDGKARIMQDIEASPPVYVVVSENAYAPFDDLKVFIGRQYRLVDHRNDWSLWRLSDVAEAPALNLMPPAG